MPHTDVQELFETHITRFVAWLELQMGPCFALGVTQDTAGQLMGVERSFLMPRSNEYAAQV